MDKVVLSCSGVCVCKKYVNFVAKEQSRNSEYDVRFYSNPSLFCGMTLLQAVFVYTYYGNNFVCINVSFCFQVRQDAAPARNEVGKLPIYSTCPLAPVSDGDIL
jgi:hypothetical protein